MSDIKNGKQVRSPIELRHFADDLENSFVILNKMGKLPELDTQSASIEILTRLQPYVQSRWKRFALDTKKDKDAYPTLRQFVELVSDLALEANDPVYGKINIKQSNDQKPKMKHSSLHTSTSVGAKSPPTAPFKGKQERPCILCGEAHRLWYCHKFKEMKVKDRLDLMKANDMCQNCLIRGHRAEDCRKPSVCSVEGCGKKHTKFLHVNVTVPVVNTLNNNTCVNFFMPVVPVMVNDTYHTYAILDTASSGTFCVRGLKDKLNLDCKEISYNLSTLSQTNEIKKTHPVLISSLALRVVMQCFCQMFSL